MRFLARLVLTFLLAIALPLQGVAAATMIACGARSHEHALAPGVSHGGHAADSTGHDHDHSYAANSSHGAPVDHSHGDKSAPAKVSLHKCSVCASCCTGAAVPSRVIAFEPVELTDPPAPLATCSVPAYVNEGLERPPRSILV